MGKPERDNGGSGFSGYMKAIRTAGPLFNSGIQLAASVILMFFVGRWLDDVLESAPWLMITGIFFGFGAGLYNFMRIVNRIDKNQTKE